MFNWFFNIRSFENEVHTRTLHTQIWVTLRSEGIRPAEDFEEVNSWIHEHREKIDLQEYADTCEMIMDNFPRATKVKVLHGGHHFGAAVSK
jgi:hypothetical protein